MGGRRGRKGDRQGGAVTPSCRRGAAQSTRFAIYKSSRREAAHPKTLPEVNCPRHGPTNEPCRGPGKAALQRDQWQVHRRRRCRSVIVHLSSDWMQGMPNCSNCRHRSLRQIHRERRRGPHHRLQLREIPHGRSWLGRHLSSCGERQQVTDARWCSWPV